MSEHDLACGCRDGVMVKRLCGYHEGYRDAEDASRVMAQGLQQAEEGRVAAILNGARYQEALERELEALRQLAVAVEQAIDAKDQGWPGAFKMLRKADRRYRAFRAEAQP